MEYINYINSFSNAQAIDDALSAGTLQRPYTALDLSTGKVVFGVEEPEAQLFYNGQLVTGASHGGVTSIYLNSTDTSVTFDVVMKNQSTPWVIVKYDEQMIALAQGTGSTSNVSMEVYPDIPDFMRFPFIMKYKQEGDQDGEGGAPFEGWTGEACWFMFRLNNA